MMKTTLFGTIQMIVSGRMTFAFGLAVIVALFIALAARPAHAATTFTVDRSDDVVATACTSAANDCSLRGAISVANNTAGSDTIDFADGITTVTLALKAQDNGQQLYENDNAGGDLDITDDLTIDGGSSGVIIEGGSGWNERILDVIGAAGAGNSNDVTLSHITIRGGHADFVVTGGIDQGFGTDKGGGIRTNGSAVQPNGASLTLRNSTVTDNTSAQSGGGIHDDFQSTIVLEDSTVSNNFAGRGINGDGGGIRSSGPLTLTRSTISGNTGTDLGGGLSVVGVSTLLMTDSTISGNTATRSGGSTDGGGIYAATSGTVTLTNSSVSGNTAEAGPNTSTFSAGFGGGVYIDSGTVTSKNSTVSGNTAQGTTALGSDGRGGGIYNNGGTLTLANGTVADNTAGSAGTNGRGGGIYSNTGSTTTLRNTILARNTADVGSNGDGANGAFTSQGYNLIGDTWLAFFFNQTGDQTGVANPGLGLLADNGGPTKTHALQSGSPAIDTGNPTQPGGGSPACEATDQRGETRPADGDGNGTATCDIGAFEKAAGSGGGGGDDTTPPTLDINNGVTPANGAKGVSRTTNISATFSEPMDLDSLKAAGVFTLKNTKTGAIVQPTNITLSSDGKTVTLDPFGPTTQKLSRRTTYEVRIKGGTGGAADAAGNVLAQDAVWSFKTGRR